MPPRHDCPDANRRSGGRFAGGWQAAFRTDEKG